QGERHYPEQGDGGDVGGEVGRHAQHQARRDSGQPDPAQAAQKRDLRGGGRFGGGRRARPLHRPAVAPPPARRAEGRGHGGAGGGRRHRLGGGRRGGGAGQFDDRRGHPDRDDAGQGQRYEQDVDAGPEPALRRQRERGLHANREDNEGKHAAEVAGAV